MTDAVFCLLLSRAKARPAPTERACFTHCFNPHPTRRRRKHHQSSHRNPHHTGVVEVSG
nr:MAG TPA: hypothetical protein [Caudoviricetes sp.]